MLTAEGIAKALACGQRGCRCGKRYSDGWLTHCPAHQDKNPSLSVSEDNGKLLVYCHAGCSQEAVIDALKARDLWPARNSGSGAKAFQGPWGKSQGRKAARTGNKPQGEPSAVYDYLDAKGSLLFQVLRFPTGDGDKTFRQRRPDPDRPGQWLWNLKGVRPVPYRLPELLAADPEAPVFVVEGEKDVDRLVSLSLTATCNPGGAGKWRVEYNQYFRGRRVVILPDNDRPGQDHALKVARALHGVAASVKILNLPALPEKGDVSDWLNAGGTAEELLALAEAAPEWESATVRGEESQKRKPENQAELLVKLAAEAELFHDAAGKTYAAIPVGDHFENWPLQGPGFQGWLRERFFRAYNKPPASQALHDAIELLAARALFEGPELPLFVRVAHLGDRVWVDLADPEWRAVEIGPRGWRVVNRPVVKFLRRRGIAPLPVPEPGGSLADLRPFVNCREEDWPLVVAWLAGALSPGPYPILTLIGEQGSAKTTTARVLKSLLDPSVAPQRTAPRDERDLMISAANGWVLSFDNLSSLPPWLSDAFCRLSTGGGLGTRELYSDAAEVLFEAMRPLILNGIDLLSTRGDLDERSIVLHCPPILEEARRPERQFWQDFAVVQPRILGALFTAVSAALANQDRVRLLRLPRMADFTLWVTAAEPALPWEPGTFITAYERNRAKVMEDSLEADPVASAVLTLMQSRNIWQGTASELLDALEDLARESTLKSKLWPKAPNILSNRLRRAAPFLRANGVEIERNKSGLRSITIRKSPQKTAQTAQTAQSEESCGDGGGRSWTVRNDHNSGSSRQHTTDGADLEDTDGLDDFCHSYSTFNFQEGEL